MKVEVRQIAGRRMEINAREVTTVIDDLVEQGGPGDGFRPTELLVGALGACTMGTILTFAKNTEMDVTGVSMSIEAEKADTPSRVGSISMVLEVAGDLDDDDLERLARIAEGCTVHNTLKNEPAIELNLVGVG